VPTCGVRFSLITYQRLQRQELLLQDAVDSQGQRLRASTDLLDTSMSLIQETNSPGSGSGSGRGSGAEAPPAKPKTVSSKGKPPPPPPNRKPPPPPPPAKPKTVSSSSKNSKEEMAIVNMESRGLYAKWTRLITQAEDALKKSEDVARKTVKDQSIVISKLKPQISAAAIVKQRTAKEVETRARNKAPLNPSEALKAAKSAVQAAKAAYSLRSLEVQKATADVKMKDKLAHTARTKVYMAQQKYSQAAETLRAAAQATAKADLRKQTVERSQKGLQRSIHGYKGRLKSLQATAKRSAKQMELVQSEDCAALKKFHSATLAKFAKDFGYPKVLARCASLQSAQKAACGKELTPWAKARVENDAAVANVARTKKQLMLWEAAVKGNEAVIATTDKLLAKASAVRGRLQIHLDSARAALRVAQIGARPVQHYLHVAVHIRNALSHSLTTLSRMYQQSLQNSRVKAARAATELKQKRNEAIAHAQRNAAEKGSKKYLTDKSQAYEAAKANVTKTADEAKAAAKDADVAVRQHKANGDDEDLKKARDKAVIAADKAGKMAQAAKEDQAEAKHEFEEAKKKAGRTAKDPAPNPPTGSSTNPTRTPTSAAGSAEAQGSGEASVKRSTGSGQGSGQASVKRSTGSGQGSGQASVKQIKRRWSLADYLLH